VQTTTPTTSTTPTSIWILIGALSAIIIGLAATILKVSTGAGWADATLACGGPAAGATMVIALAIITTVRPSR
jgi:hypothetical protein